MLHHRSSCTSGQCKHSVCCRPTHRGIAVALLLRCCNRAGAAQVFYRHGRLRMYRRCQEVRTAGQDGLAIVINGLVRISYRDPFGNHQQFFLGTGALPAGTSAQHPPRGRSWLPGLGSLQPPAADCTSEHVMHAQQPMATVLKPVYEVHASDRDQCNERMHKRNPLEAGTMSHKSTFAWLMLPAC